MNSWIRWLLAAVWCGLASCAGPPQVPVAGGHGGDLAFLPAKPEKGRLFTFYNYHGTSARSDNWTRRFDLSGVAWDDPRTVTAISRQHVVMAGHFMRAAFTPVLFHDRSGRKHERRIVNVRTLSAAGDIAVGRLDQPLPAGVTHYRLAGPGDASAMRLALVTDQTRTLSLHRIGQVASGKVMLGYDPRIPKTYWRNLVVGDSGNPAFVIDGGELLLLTTFSTGGPGVGPFYGDPAVRQAVMDAMRAL